ncbi:CoA ester lyase [Microbacterium trichothecenolyticum]|uniref:HpcH/HpaI aldolase/citrate lyase family protein n=1 Tax=Microbacterium trichothecenolyticum TaxID=69370 RepID=UPI001C6DE08D|nr:CoA ester lyase [Microbacterium trichothecenolyticum]MBW9122324.1 CoA ester lyase [Microbacterium trichothecenolyticum]
MTTFTGVRVGIANGMSALFVPGNKPALFDKAAASGAHAVIADLEDAVAPAERSAARTAVKAAVLAGQPLAVRINAPGAPDHALDLALLAEMRAAGSVPVAVVLAKTEEAADVADVIRASGAGTQVIALIETARGIVNAPYIAQADGLARIAFGALDYALDIDAEGDTALLFARSTLVVASRAAGLPAPLDSPTANFRDLEAVQSEAAEARRLGFGGKLCIHPAQVRPVHTVFQPTESEITRARRVVAAAEAADGGVVQVDGEMVDTPVVDAARRILQRAAP